VGWLLEVDSSLIHIKNFKISISKFEKKLEKLFSLILNPLIPKLKNFQDMMKDCYQDFLQMKVRKCINNEYGKYKHRGHYFKKYQAIA
jgi:hypothetical protein